MRSSNALICPLSPSTPPVGDPSDDGDPGWHDLESAPIQVEQPANAARDAAEADDVVDAEDGEEVQMPRGIPPPPEPTAAEIARHNLTHYPYRSWCPHCLASRRPNSHHRQSRSTSSRKVPLFCADYCFVKDSVDEAMGTVLAGRLYPSNAVFATVCDSKGV